MKVMFRKWKTKKGWDTVIDAIFPEEPGTTDPNTLSVYSRIGQHGTGVYGYWNGTTVPAKPIEYSSLLKELISLGYKDLRVVQRIPRQASEKIRREKIRESKK